MTVTSRRYKAEVEPFRFQLRQCPVSGPPEAQTLEKARCALSRVSQAMASQYWVPREVASFSSLMVRPSEVSVAKVWADTSEALTRLAQHNLLSAYTHSEGIQERNPELVRPGCTSLAVVHAGDHHSIGVKASSRRLAVLPPWQPPFPVPSEDVLLLSAVGAFCSI